MTILIKGLPVAEIAKCQASGNPIVGPGSPTNIVGGMPVTLLGDAVAGPTCVGAIAQTTAINYIVKGRPRVVSTSLASGSNPAALGTPITLPVIGDGGG
jgi:hypothetical protein